MTISQLALLFPMTVSHTLFVLSAISTGLGTYLVKKYSVTLAQFPAYMSPKLVEEVKAANAKRLKGQEIGYAFLYAGIALACFGALV